MQTNEIDLFEQVETLPNEVQAVLEKYQDCQSYDGLNSMLSELEPLGYTFDYYLDAMPYNLRKIETA